MQQIAWRFVWATLASDTHRWQELGLTATLNCKGWEMSSRKMIRMNVGVPVAISTTGQSEQRNVPACHLKLLEAGSFPW